MALHWWNRSRRKSIVRRASSPRLLRPRFTELEDRTTPTITINSLTLTPPGPINEGSVSILNCNYSATNVIGALQLTITGTPAVIQVTPPVITSGVNQSFSVPIAFLDNATPPTTPVSVNVSIKDTGLSELSFGADGGGYRAFSVPFISNVNLLDSFNSVGAASQVNPIIFPSSSNDSQINVIPLGVNNFRFYGTQVGSPIGVSENGLITFFGTPPNNTNTNGPLSNLPVGLGVLAPMWTDLVLSPTGRVSYRFVDLDGNSSNGQEYLVVEWANVLHRTPGGGTTPQVGTLQCFLQLNTPGTTNGDVIFNYVDTDFGNPNYNFGADATVGIRNRNFGSTGFTQLSFNPGSSAPIISNYQSGHAVRFSSNAISTPPGFGTTDAFGYQAFHTPFESKIDLVNSNFNGQQTSVLLTGTFDNNSGFTFNTQQLLSAITIGANPVITANTFNFYGTNYTNLSISKNGYMALGGAASPNTPNNPTSLSDTPDTAAISPLWDDWNGLAGAGAQVMARFLDFDGNGRPEYIVLDWKGVSNGGINPTTPENFATFQTILQLNTGGAAGGIFFNYQDTDVGNANFNNGASATVGIKDTNPTNGRFLDIYVNTASVDLSSSRAIGVFQVGFATQSILIQVDNVAPVLSANPNDNLVVNEGSPFTRTIFVTDPGVLDYFNGFVDFGDGTGPQPLTSNVPNLPAGTTSFPINHIYGDNGMFDVTVTLMDKDGGVAVPFVFTVTVNNVPPTLSVAPNQLLVPGQRLVLDGLNGKPFLATFTDPGFTPIPPVTEETFTTTIDWGDGIIEVVPPNTLNVTQTVINGSPGVPTRGTIAASHLFGGVGTFIVRITVTDDDGGFATQTLEVAVGSTTVYTVGADAGGLPTVKVYNATLNILAAQFNAYSPNFTGGVRTAVGDINGDTLADIVTAAGPTGGPHIRVFSGVDNTVIREFMAYDIHFTGGVYVAVGDINGDGIADIVTGAGEGGGPHVKAFSGVDNSLLFDGFAYDPSFRGGVRVAVGDINGDGRGDIITAAGPGGGPHVKVFSGLNGQVLSSFMAYDLDFVGGVFVSAGDFNHDGNAEVVTGPGIGGGPDLRLYNAQAGGILIANSMPFPPRSSGGIFTGDQIWASGLRVGVTDFNNDGQLDILVAPGSGERSMVRVLSGYNLGILYDFTAFDPGFLGGVFVSGN